MLKLYREHPEFDQFSCFDVERGVLEQLSENHFRSKLPKMLSEALELTWKGPIGDELYLYSGGTSETHTRFPRRVYFQITRHCNLRCNYCYLSAAPGLAHVPTATAIKAAEFLGQEGLMEVRLTGGEPLEHPGFFEIVDAFQKAHVYVSVATNGVIGKQNLERLCQQRNLWLICSLDGDRETHNHFRPGTFDKIISNLRFLKLNNPRLRLRLTAVLTKHNRHDVTNLCRLGAELGAESLTVIPLRPQVRSPEVLADMVSASEFRAVIEELLEAQARYGIRVTTTLETDYAGKIHRDPVVRKRSSCAAGREATNLDYDARSKRFVVYGCSYSPAADYEALPALRAPFVAGTFPADEFEQFTTIWESESAWKIYRDLSLRSDECWRCSYWKDHSCIGSCPIQNLDFTTVQAERDVLQQLKVQLQKTAEWYCYQKIC